MQFGKIDKPIKKTATVQAKTAKQNNTQSSSKPAMTFGLARTSQAVKDLNIKKETSLIYDSVSGIDDYFIILVDYVIKDKAITSQLRKDLAVVGIKEYLILSIVSLTFADDSSTDKLLTFESDWRKYLTYKGKNCKAIAAAGRAIRVLNRSADLNYLDFIDDQFAPYRYFCGSAYVGGPDKWIYPMPPIDFAYPFKETKGDFVNYNTRFLRRQLAHMSNETDFSLDSLDARPINIVDASEEDKIDESLNKLLNADLLAIDTETNGLKTFVNRIGTLQMTADGETSYFFDWFTLKNHKRLLTKVLRSAKRLVLANAKFDIRMLNAQGVHNVWPTDDTTLLAHAMNSHRPKGLKPNTWFWCGTFGGYDDKLDMIKKKMKVSNYLMIPKPILMEYASIDPVVTWRQLVAMEKWCHHLDEAYPNEKIPEWTIWRFYKEIMMQNLNVLIKIELNGVFFDKKKMAEVEKQNNEIIKNEANEMARLWNCSPDYEFSSTTKLGQLFKSMGWPCIEESKNGGYATSESTLREYKRLGYPGIDNLQKYRSFNVANNTFIKGWGQFVIDHEDGTSRVHQNTNSFGTVSFRHAQNDPNFQQIPSGGVISHGIKQFFCNPPSHQIYEVEDDKGNKWDNSEYLKVILKDGRSVDFDELTESDEIVDYDKSATIYDTKSCWMY